MIGLEVVGIGVELQQVSVGKGEHGIDDAKNDLADCVVNQGEISNIGSAREVELQERWIDE